jgi:hypothetical protein
MKLQHIVLFSFPEELSPEDEDDMRSQIASWPAQIPEIKRLRFGKDLTGERTRGHSHLLHMELDGTEELRRYQQHPVHQVFHRWVIDHRGTPLAFDYFLDTDTVLMPEDRKHAEEERR